MRQTAEKNHCFIFEAARNYHEEALPLSKLLADKQVLGADFNYAKYSSKMPDLLAGQTPNVFSDRFAGGSSYGLGDLSPLRCLFVSLERLRDATYQAQQLDNSIDLNGDGILFYPDFQVHIKAGKTLLPIFLVRFTQQMEP